MALKRRRGVSVLGGVSDAAGLLKLAKAVTRRASRAIDMLAEDGRRYLELLLAEVVARGRVHVEEYERSQVPNQFWE
jgi:cob(I)alamin adenosyltransferase